MRPSFWAAAGWSMAVVAASIARVTEQYGSEWESVPI